MFFHYFSFLLFIVWDPNRDIFTLPFFSHPISWYGVLFAGSFFAGFYIVRELIAAHLTACHFKGAIKIKAVQLADQLAILVVIGAVLGARLGHIFFYEWAYYSKHPLAIFKVWEGGLASHGGATGIFIALILFTLWHRKDPLRITFIGTLDLLSIPAAFAGGCIRIGNFINQEILGTPTQLPWGVIYIHPAQPVGKIPLHPVQIYESFGYFLVSFLLIYAWKKGGKKLGSGLMSGLFFVLVFSFRFLIEFIKFPQSDFDSVHFFNMGQFLSLPFILVGVFLVFRFFFRKEYA